ncbi:GvpL/GvpF family gas vesicle protein [Amycolatopsis cynarae]|uniref:GvpL/GvpF family gas vesicle protein n=1 Tax=Amycolatopsis cynarae TaxID=2995223 RepID=A0ABY7BE70_9PSEU|nr:GvpL/GvpF family gas vesicle protein [Amycolatopsis sp. HUAS 11-8]WAL68918.1 GvpL/GvpF family gas vesicle protein [Amycolatopsis sp. HUAS 11-8]
MSEQEDQRGSWLYAVTTELDPGVLTALTGVSGERPRAVEGAGLTAVAGTVPLESFGEEALRRNLEDLDWLAAVARAHDAVVDAVVRARPAVPLRLATVYHDDDRVRAVLAEREGDFRRLLDLVSGRTEWGVKAFLDPSRLREPEPAASGASGPGAGAAYLRRKRSQHLAKERAEQIAAEQARAIHEALAALSAEARTHRPQARQLAGNDLPMILNGAYLVDDSASSAFAEAVAAQDRAHEAIQLRLTGPWPPYSFSALEEEP